MKFITNKYLIINRENNSSIESIHFFTVRKLEENELNEEIKELLDKSEDNTFIIPNKDLLVRFNILEIDEMIPKVCINPY